MCESEAARTGSPRFSRGLMASLLTHGIRLTLVLGHPSVNTPEIHQLELDN